MIFLFLVLIFCTIYENFKGNITIGLTKFIKSTKIISILRFCACFFRRCGIVLFIKAAAWKNHAGIISSAHYDAAGDVAG